MNLWWKRLEKSLINSDQHPESRFFQLATIDKAGLPHNRTVVYREPPGNGTNTSLYFVTDVRSQKWGHLAHTSRASVCWYFAAQREQYRLNCSSYLHHQETGSPVVNELWKTLSEATKLPFYRGYLGVVKDTKKERATIPYLDDLVPDNFGVVELIADEVDYLSLQTQPHYREHHCRQADGEWEIQQLQP